MSALPFEVDPVDSMLLSRPNNQRGTRTYTVYAAAKSAGLANAYVDSQKSDEILREPCSYYGSATVPKWPQKQSQSIQFLKFSGGACPQTPLVLHAYPYIHSHVTDVTPLLKVQATGLDSVTKICL